MGLHSPARILIPLLLATFTVTTTAQQIAPMSKREAAVRQEGASLALQAPIGVVPLHGPEEFGTFSGTDAQEIRFYDIEAKAAVILPFTEIRRIKNGYGDYNGSQHRHVDRTHTYLVADCIVTSPGGALLALVMANN